MQSDAIGRELMEPGQAVYAKIAAHFGPDVVLADGRLDRGALARIAFTDGRVEELNAIVHPAAFAVSGAYTPVPGGVGALTIAMLMQNTVTAAKLRRGQPVTGSAKG